MKVIGCNVIVLACTKHKLPIHLVAPLNPPPSPTTDVAVILEEIELTRNTLAEVQALQLEVSGVDLVPLPAEQQVSEESLTSQQWLEVSSKGE